MDLKLFFQINGTHAKCEVTKKNVNLKYENEQIDLSHNKTPNAMDVIENQTTHFHDTTKMNLLDNGSFFLHADHLQLFLKRMLHVLNREDSIERIQNINK